MKCAAIVLILGVFVTSALAQGFDAKSLKGIKGFGVLVESLCDDANIISLSKSTIETDVELRFRSHGIKVLTMEETHIQPGCPFFYVNINLIYIKGLNSVVYNIEGKFAQDVMLTRNNQPYPQAPTWHTGGILGIVDRQSARNIIRETVLDIVDKFINDYFSVNPK